MYISGAALVVNLLLITSTNVTASTLPTETTSTTLNNDRSPYAKNNDSLWVEKNKSKVPDTALNELNPKDSSSEENTEKNAKYKDRGRVKFNLQFKSTTGNPLKRVTKPTDVVIVTPTPEVRKPAQIIDSMRNFKKTKIPAVTIVSSTEPIKPIQDDEYDDEEEDEDSFEKFTEPKFDDSSFFTIPSFDDDDDYSTRKYKHGSDRHSQHDYNTPTFSTFSDFFPKNLYSLNHEEKYNSESYIDFNSELTTPKNQFFDNKHHQISSSIVNKLDKSKTIVPSSNETKAHDTMNEDNMDFDKLSNNSLPSNKSTVFIKNTKEIRYVDNDDKGIVKKGQTDVHGTSIYYEMTVLSTETYTKLDKDEDDCDENEPSATTVSTPLKEELASIRAAKPKWAQRSTTPTIPDSKPSPVSISSVSSNYFPRGTPFAFTTLNPISYSTQNVIISTTDTPKVYSSSYSRNRNYSKRLNLSGAKDSPNSVSPTLQTDQVSPNQVHRPQTRRFHHTTPKTKPIWMAPRRNATRRIPTTIYSEHFDIKDKVSSTHKPKLPTRTVLTTQTSELIDPVLQSDPNTSQKTVQSPSISDNTIPSLWKRGSSKFGASTTNSAEKSTGSSISDLEIPPTLTAWALASLRSPPSSSSAVMNATTSTQKSIDENELQKVGEVVGKILKFISGFLTRYNVFFNECFNFFFNFSDKKETTTSSSMTSTAAANGDFVTKNITEINQNRLPWKPLSPTLPVSVETKEKPSESNSERVPAESNISIQSSQEPPSTEQINTKSVESSTERLNINNQPSWIPVTNAHNQVYANEIKESSDVKVILPVDATKSTGFESITKLPAEITTPTDDTVDTSKEKKETTTDYEITTIRFSYVPTESIETTGPDENTEWHPVFPTRTHSTTEEQNPITTYRPKYVTTTEMSEEGTTTSLESTPQIEETSQTEEKTADNVSTTEPTNITTTSESLPATTITLVTTTEAAPHTTQIIKETTEPITEIVTSVENTTSMHIKTTTELDNTTPIETTTIIVSVATEINSERVTVTTYIPPDTTEVEVETSKSSEENINSNEGVAGDTTEPPQTTTEGFTKIERVVTTVEVRYPTTSPRTTTEAETTTIKVEDETTTVEVTTDATTKSVNDLEDLTSYAEDVTTEASSRVLEQEAGTGAAIAIAVSTIGVIALVLLVGLLVSGFSILIYSVLSTLHRTNAI